jgi:hypothetical protein
MCNLNEYLGAVPKKVCFHPDGTMVNPLEAGGGGSTIVYPLCPTMQREPSAACPPVADICGWKWCGQRLVVAGDAITEGENCCYEGVICLGQNGCGRPLIVAGSRRAARLVRGLGW